MRLYTLSTLVKKQGLVQNLDYEKAFDMVNLDLLVEILELRGFGSAWLSWIAKITHGGYVAFKLNKSIGDIFVAIKGLRQGDPIFAFSLTQSQI